MFFDVVWDVRTYCWFLVDCCVCGFCWLVWDVGKFRCAFSVWFL